VRSGVHFFLDKASVAPYNMWSSAPNDSLQFTLPLIAIMLYVVFRDIERKLRGCSAVEARTQQRQASANNLHAGPVGSPRERVRTTAVHGRHGKVGRCWLASALRWRAVPRVVTTIDSTAIRPRYGHSTTNLTIGLLHCGLI